MKSFALVLLLPWFLLTLPSGPDTAYAVTELVSVGISGDPADGVCDHPSINGDGSVVVFSSAASNLVPGGPSGTNQIYVRDRVGRATERVSVLSDGTPADLNCGFGVVSADGRYVTFESWAQLTTNDTDDELDIFIHDRQTGMTDLVSVDSQGDPIESYCSGPAMTPDGRYVVFTSVDALWETSQIYVWDRQTGSSETVDVIGEGEPVTGLFQEAVPSADGRFVAFKSTATGIVPGDTNECADVFVKDRVSGMLERASTSSMGEQATGASGYPGFDVTGQLVVFESVGSDLVPGDLNGNGKDVFLHDRSTGATECISLNDAGEFSSWHSAFPSVSSDGRYIAFGSWGTNLVPGDANGAWDCFVRDRRLGTTRRVSLRADSSEIRGAMAVSTPNTISADGRFVAFLSDAGGVVAQEPAGVQQVYVNEVRLFDDVARDYWAYEAIEACVAARVVTGFRDGTYRPAAQVHRDEMAVYIARAAAGGDAAVPPGPRVPHFYDVPVIHWAYDYIQYCYDQGIVRGTGRLTYSPHLTVDRGQMAVFVARSRGWVALDDDMTTAPDLFPDVPAGYWAGTAIEACVTNGVVQGYDDGLYRPETVVTRDQMAVYIARAFELTY